MQSLVGAQWLYIAGDTLGPDFNTPFDVIVGTTGGSVRVVSTIDEADFQYDEPMTYSVLSISEDVSGFTQARRRGNVYVHHQREYLIDLLIVRETIIEIENEQESWEYITDIGVVFVLSRGAVAVSKGSHHTQMLVVRMAPTVDALGIAHRAIEWTDDLTIKHLASRQFLQIETLLT